MLLAPLAAYGQADKWLEQRMRDIIIPSIEFREANPIDVLQFLLEASTAADPKTPSLGLLSTNTPATRVYYTYEVEGGSREAGDLLVEQHGTGQLFDAGIGPETDLTQL